MDWRHKDIFTEPIAITNDGDAYDMLRLSDLALPGLLSAEQLTTINRRSSDEITLKRVACVISLELPSTAPAGDGSIDHTSTLQLTFPGANPTAEVRIIVVTTPNDGIAPSLGTILQTTDSYGTPLNPSKRTKAMYKKITDDAEVIAVPGAMVANAPDWVVMHDSQHRLGHAGIHANRPFKKDVFINFNFQSGYNVQYDNASNLRKGGIWLYMLSSGPNQANQGRPPLFSSITRFVYTS